MVLFRNDYGEAFRIREDGQKCEMLFVLPNGMGRGFARDDLAEDTVTHTSILPHFLRVSPSENKFYFPFADSAITTPLTTTYMPLTQINTVSAYGDTRLPEPGSW